MHFRTLLELIIHIGAVVTLLAAVGGLIAYFLV